MTAHILFIAGADADLRLPFVRAVRDHGFRVSMAASGGGAAFDRAGIEFVQFPFDRFISPLSDWRAIRRLRNILSQLRPDIAQGFDTKPCLMLPLAARDPDLLVIRTICGRGWVYSSRSPAAMCARLAYRALHGIAARRTNATVFQNRSDRAFFEGHGIAGAQGVVIPAGGGGIDPESFEQALQGAPTAAALRAELGLGSAEVVITVSRITRQKGVPALLRAAELVHRQRPKVRFLLAGPRESEGPLAISEADLAAHESYVIAIGPRTDVPALLRMADVFAFPTEYSEGVPRVLLEAALASLPIITTSMPGCLEVIEDGITGRVVPPRSPEKLAEQILAALVHRDKSAAMAARLPERVRTNFSVAGGAERHAALYRALLADRSNSRAATATKTGLDASADLARSFGSSARSVSDPDE
ncbi:MAG: glycosyl transferase family 1 [Cypionkella sp.]|uniref:glycosyltransferase n=1 Tax=Cypionkella sp. TaxID=2811411 RepID=UPI002609A723|nr:glycosyltransferase [Cypionkella sp.]MDB5658128.1 glycosyl transferase family 1 [Cypionkella sp.]